MASPQESESAIEQSRLLAQFKKLHTLSWKHQISHALPLSLNTRSKSRTGCVRGVAHLFLSVVCPCG
jgi:hypothetical protein